MSSSLFRKPPQAQPQQTQGNDLISAVENVKRQIGNQNPAAILQQMCQRDPQVAAFVQQFRGVDPRQLAAQFFGKK